MRERTTRALMLFTLVPFVTSLQYANRRHFLLLHGSGTSAGAFVNSPTAAGAKNFLQGVPRRPDQGNGFVPLNWQYSAVDAGTPNGDWWQGDGYKGLDDAVAEVEAAIEAEQGAITGIIGHEQGGLVAAIVAARAALGMGPVASASASSLSGTALKFAVICGAGMPDAGPYAALLGRMRDTPGADIQTLHCLSEADPAYTRGEELASCFTSAEILWHNRGTAMPDKSWWKATQAFPDRATGVMRFVDQFTVARTNTPVGFTTPTNEFTPTALPTEEPTALPTLEPTVSY
jgi:pimeloyl-ACP methyl ester carboxylesterase